MRLAAPDYTQNSCILLVGTEGTEMGSEGMSDALHASATPWNASNIHQEAL